MLGRTDDPATAEGVAACVRRAAGLQFERVLTSGLERADTCATAIANAAAVPLERDNRWRELDFGAWDGLPIADIDARALAAYWADPETACPPGGERWSSMVGRIAAAIATVDRPILAVSHGGAIRAALAAACGFAYPQLWAFDLPYSAVVSLRLWRGAGQIVALRT